MDNSGYDHNLLGESNTQLACPCSSGGICFSVFPFHTLMSCSCSSICLRIGSYIPCWFQRACITTGHTLDGRAPLIVGFAGESGFHGVKWISHSSSRCQRPNSAGERGYQPVPLCPAEGATWRVGWALGCLFLESPSDP